MKQNAQLRSISHTNQSIIRGSHVATLNNLTSLTKNYTNRLVWVIDVKCYYYLDDGKSGALVSDWVKFSPSFKVELYDSEKIYTLGEFCVYGNGDLYYSKIDNNENNIPTSDPLKWRQLVSVSIFNPTSAEDTEDVNTSVGGILAGTTVGDLRNQSLETIIYNMLFPVKSAYVHEPKKITQTFGLQSLMLQVGTKFNLNFDITIFNGLIKNGTDTDAGPIAGDMTKIWIEDSNNNEILTDLTPTNPSTTLTKTNHVVTVGTTNYTAYATHASEDTTYSTSRGVVENHLNSMIASGNISVACEPIIGVYNYWVYIGNQANVPVSSTDVKSLTITGPTLSDVENELIVNPGDSNVIIYSKQNVVSLTNKSNGDVMLPDASVDFNIITDDTTSVYKMHIFNFGLTGFPVQTKLTMKIVA